jgi:hypothetical protein
MFTSRALASVAIALMLTLAPVAACGGRGSGPQAGNPPSPTQSDASPTLSPSVSTPNTPTKPPTSPPTATGPAGHVVSARVAYRWNWPNDADRPGSVTHNQHVPPVPALVAIGAGDHPNDPGERAFNRMAFTFDTGFPSYRFEFQDKLYADGTGAPIPLAGLDVLVVRFQVAQAHSAGGGSTIVSKPPAGIGYERIVSYAQGGDNEGVLTYGIGITYPNPHSNPQIGVRAYEVERVNASGQHRYVVAIDVESG